MKKTYLVKKNPNMPESENNWIVMNGFEFARFMETEDGRKRKNNFGQLDSCGDGDDIIVAECGEERAKTWRAEKDAHDYLVEQEIESGIETLSFDALDSEEDETTGAELMVDEDCDVVADIIAKIDHEKLIQAITSLNSEERELLNDLYLREKPMSLREAGAKRKLHFTTVDYRNKTLLAKMKKYF